MNFAIEYQKKVDKTVQAIINKFSKIVIGIYAIGSITQESTPISDLDIVVIFEDNNYNNNLDEIRNSFSKIVDEINTQIPLPELMLWSSKVDNYRTYLPDVSYVRNNLPYRVTRLDAWCGLAKHTLIHYECASAKKLYGEFDLKPVYEKIPLSECLELFLISTRTLAEGIRELASIDPNIKQRGISHVAKAGLRAIYSVLIREDRKPRNSYSEIYETAKIILPQKFHLTLETLYRAKIGGSGSCTIDLIIVLELFRYCESQIAMVCRKQINGLAYGMRGESFGYSPDSLFDKIDLVEEYSRFPLFTENYPQALYYILSAYEISNRFEEIISDLTPDILDFYFEEFTILGTFALFLPDGLRIVLGHKERSLIELKLGLEFVQYISTILIKLAEYYLSIEDDSSFNPWLSMQEKLLRISAMLIHIDQILKHSIPQNLIERLETKISNSEVLLINLEWQSELLSGIYSLDVIRAFSAIGLTLYQAGELELAEKILQRMLEVENIKTIAVGETSTNIATEIDKELSKVHQYLGVIHQRKQNINKAKKEYEVGLNLDPNNYSLVDDYAYMLLNHEPNIETLLLLQKVINNATKEQNNVRLQVVNRIQELAINLKQQGDFESSKEWYKFAIEIDPMYEKVYHNFAVLHQHLGNYNEAMNLYKNAIKLNPDYGPSYIGLGIILEKRGKHHEVVSLLNEAIQRKITNEAIWTNLGNNYLFLNELSSAVNCYDKALEFDENYANALAGKASCLMVGPDRFKTEIISKAAEYFLRAYKIDSTFIEAKMGYEKAMQLLKK